MTAGDSVAIAEERDIVAARQAARRLAVELGFGVMDQSRITTAVSELARNVVRYATDGRGDVYLRALRGTDGVMGIEVVVEDEGPGMDVTQAMQQGFSSERGLGLGLGGTKRLMDEMEVESEPGKATRITVRKWRR